MDSNWDERASFSFTLTAAPSVEPGIYEVRIDTDTDIAKFIDDYKELLAREGGYSSFAGTTTLIVEVTPSWP